MNILPHSLRDLASRILVAAGASAEDAELVAGNLVESNLVGHDSHGIIRLPRYIKAIGAGGIDVNARPRVVTETPGTLVIDGGWGFGQRAATMAMDLAIEKARAQGVAGVAVFNCNDIARLGAYTLRAIAHDCIGILTLNDGGSNSYVAPWGGRSALLSTNPISVALPAGDKPPVCTDLATSVTAGSQVQLAGQRGALLPPGCIIDADGRPSTNPHVLFGALPGALLPLGAPVAGHKGFGLSLAIDIIAGALSGAGCSGSGERDAQGIFIQAIDIAAFTPMQEFLERVTQLIETIKATPKAEGVTEILIPGERSAREKAARTAAGIHIEDATWEAIMEISREFGLEDNC